MPFSRARGRHKACRISQAPRAEGHPFGCQQDALALDRLAFALPTEAAHGEIGRYYAVTGHPRGKRVATQGLADGLCAAASDRLPQAGIRRDTSARYT